MSDPLSTAASALAFVGAAYSSAKVLYDLVDDLKNAPKLIVDIKTDIESVRDVLQSIETTLKEKPATLKPMFRAIGAAAGACDEVTKDFTKTIDKYTSHSKDGSLSKRDRLTVTFRKSKLESFRIRLNAAKNTTQFAVTSATLATSAANYSSNEELKKSLEEQTTLIKSQSEQLIKIEEDMKDLEIDEAAEADEDNDVIAITTGERDLTLSIIPVLQKACEEALAVTVAQANNTVQKFGTFTADNNSKVAAGVAGSDLGPGNVHQEFGDTKLSSSQGFFGRMDSAAAKNFWGSPMPKPDAGSAAHAGSA